MADNPSWTDSVLWDLLKKVYKDDPRLEETLITLLQMSMQLFRDRTNKALYYAVIEKQKEYWRIFREYYSENGEFSPKVQELLNKVAEVEKKELVKQSRLDMTVSPSWDPEEKRPMSEYVPFIYDCLFSRSPLFAVVDPPVFPPEDPPTAPHGPPPNFLQSIAKPMNVLCDGVDFVGEGEKEPIITGEAISISLDQGAQGRILLPMCVTLDWGRLDKVYPTGKMTAFQRAVYDAVCSISADRGVPCEFTVQDVYRTLFGGIDAKHKTQTDEIDKAITTLARTWIELNTTELENAWNRGRPVQYGETGANMLDVMRRELRYPNGETVVGYVLKWSPILFDLSLMMGQYTSTPLERMAICAPSEQGGPPKRLRMTKERMLINTYLERRILKQNHVKKTRTGTILLDTLFFQTCLHRANNKQKDRYIEFIREALEDKKAKGVILGFAMQDKQGRPVDPGERPEKIEIRLPPLPESESRKGGKGS